MAAAAAATTAACSGLPLAAADRAARADSAANQKPNSRPRRFSLARCSACLRCISRRCRSILLLLRSEPPRPAPGRPTAVDRAISHRCLSGLRIGPATRDAPIGQEAAAVDSQGLPAAPQRREPDKLVVRAGGSPPGVRDRHGPRQHGRDPRPRPHEDRERRCGRQPEGQSLDPLPALEMTGQHLAEAQRSGARRAHGLPELRCLLTWNARHSLDSSTAPASAVAKRTLSATVPGAAPSGPEQAPPALPMGVPISCAYCFGEGAISAIRDRIRAP